MSFPVVSTGHPQEISETGKYLSGVWQSTLVVHVVAWVAEIWGRASLGDLKSYTAVFKTNASLLFLTPCMGTVHNHLPSALLSSYPEQNNQGDTFYHIAQTVILSEYYFSKTKLQKNHLVLSVIFLSLTFSLFPQHAFLIIKIKLHQKNACQNQSSTTYK